MIEPLAHFINKTGYDHKAIKRMSNGSKYIAVMLKNGQIGVCSKPSDSPIENDNLFEKIDLKKFSHRIFYNAYLNATLNYLNVYEDEKDIFDHVDFRKKKNIVMIGNFRSLVNKFSKSGIEVSIFDKVDKEPPILPLSFMDEYLTRANTLIITSTAIANGSFCDIINKTSSSCEIFLLGPSSIIHPLILQYRNIKKVYGSLFKLFDHHILDLIENGHGAKTFLQYGNKVNI
ncbi:MAG: hypothetical protein K9G76_10810 [Bacteroidales bacterium]|nr:hypothetical protein [Bacteroidales bacterium]MCF8404260.1 hypothetical protein [Bacteroidales bacterium]